MDPATIRVADGGDIDELCRLRLAFIAEVRQVDPATFDPPFAEVTRAFFREAMQADRIRSWLAIVDGHAVGLVSVIVTDAPPLPGRHRAREGYVINLYVAPDGRRRGTGRSLLDAALDSADALGLRGFHLYATEDGRPLYEQAGFVPDHRFLVRPVG